MVDEFIKLHMDEKLTVEQAAMAKWWTTEAQVRLIDRCLQLHGGYGYMREYNVARAFLDARVQTIYGGTTEIMKEIIGRGLGSDLRDCVSLGRLSAISNQFGFNLDLDAEVDQYRVSWLAVAEMCNR